MARDLVILENAYTKRVERCFSSEELKTYRELFWKMQQVKDEVLHAFLNEVNNSPSMGSLLAKLENL